MKYSIWAFVGIAAAIIITLMCVGCTEEKLATESDQGTIFINIDMYSQQSAEDPCKGIVELWYAGDKNAAYFWWQWAGMQWKYKQASNNSYRDEQEFRAGTQNLDLWAIAYDDKGNEIAKFPSGGQKSNLDIGCIGTDPGNEEIQLELNYLTPDEPKCEKILARWRGGNGPFDLLKNGFPENEIPIDGYSYGTISAIGDDWQVVDADGNESNIETWTAPGTCF